MSINSATRIIIALLVVVAAGGGAFYYFQDSPDTDQATLPPPPSENADNGSGNAPTDALKGSGTTVKPLPPPLKVYGTIKVTYPNGGELLQSGVNYVVKWSTTGIGRLGKIRIGYRSASDPSKTTKQIMLTTNVGSAAWQSPAFISPADTPTRSCKKGEFIRQEYVLEVAWIDADGEYAAKDLSDQPFAVEGRCGPLP